MSKWFEYTAEKYDWRKTYCYKLAPEVYVSFADHKTNTIITVGWINEKYIRPYQQPLPEHIRTIVADPFFEINRLKQYNQTSRNLISMKIIYKTSLDFIDYHINIQG